ncbi:hypothetical protein AAVH_23712, partial [Aphelenchoides avenae]
MSLNATALLPPKECPVCMDAYDIDVHLPKVFGCGHSVCADCVPGCMVHCATCDVCHHAVSSMPSGDPDPGGRAADQLRPS